MTKEEQLSRLNLRILELERSLKAANGEYQSAARKAREKSLAVRQIKARLFEVHNAINMLDALDQNDVVDEQKPTNKETR